MGLHLDFPLDCKWEKLGMASFSDHILMGKFTSELCNIEWQLGCNTKFMSLYSAVSNTFLCMCVSPERIHLDF